MHCGYGKTSILAVRGERCRELLGALGLFHFTLEYISYRIGGYKVELCGDMKTRSPGGAIRTLVWIVLDLQLTNPKADVTLLGQSYFRGDATIQEEYAHCNCYERTATIERELQDAACAGANEGEDIEGEHDPAMGDRPNNFPQGCHPQNGRGYHLHTLLAIHSIASVRELHPTRAELSVHTPLVSFSIQKIV